MSVLQQAVDMTKKPPMKKAPAEAGAKRGRPSGKSRSRDIFVSQVVAEIVRLGADRDRAARIAMILLAHDTVAFQKEFWRGTALSGGFWKGEDVEISVPFSRDTDEHEIKEVKLGSLIYAWWLSRWPADEKFGLPNKPICLSESAIRSIYAKAQDEMSEDMHVDCPSCGHQNYHRPGRGEHFHYGDRCRKCGGGTAGPA